MSKTTKKTSKNKKSNSVTVTHSYTNKLKALAFVVVFALAGSIYVSLTHAQTYTQVCDDASPLECLRDQSGSTATNTSITPSNSTSTSSKQYFSMEDLSEMCNNGHVTHTCPFAVGSGLNNHYYNDEIVQFVYLGSTKAFQCLGNQGATYYGGLQPCNTLNGQDGGLGTVFIINVKGGGGITNFVESKYWSNYNYTNRKLYNHPNWLCVSDDAYIQLAYNPTPAGNTCQWQSGNIGSGTSLD